MYIWQCTNSNSAALINSYLEITAHLLYCCHWKLYCCKTHILHNYSSLILCCHLLILLFITFLLLFIKSCSCSTVLCWYVIFVIAQTINSQLWGFAIIFLTISWWEYTNVCFAKYIYPLGFNDCEFCRSAKNKNVFCTSLFVCLSNTMHTHFCIKGSKKWCILPKHGSQNCVFCWSSVVCFSKSKCLVRKKEIKKLVRCPWTSCMVIWRKRMTFYNFFMNCSINNLSDQLVVEKEVYKKCCFWSVITKHCHGICKWHCKAGGGKEDVTIHVFLGGFKGI